AEETVATEAVYAGLLPAADAEGVQYILKLNYISEGDSVMGAYDLHEMYLAADSAANSVEVATEGAFVGIDKDGKSYLKLAPESNPAQEMYFFVESDSTLVLVNSELEPAANPELNYTLTLVK
ncbi:MAG: copper resistance protein NlpE, partial [Duncaniella sp.]|nr:copper resistance protein NlpE [Duncaniella sp.]